MWPPRDAHCVCALPPPKGVAFFLGAAQRITAPAGHAMHVALPSKEVALIPGMA